ncbi:MAG: glucosyl-3-phosphoglycerate synthase, partial [Verrucomicrobiota bacterium]
DQRIHRNQSTTALGKMSFGILQTFLKRLQVHGRIGEIGDLSTFYRAFQVNEGLYEQLTTEIVEEERPPMITIADYRKKFGLGNGS